MVSSVFLMLSANTAMLLISFLIKKEADITHLCTDDSPFFTSPLPEEVYEVPPGCFLNTNFHMVLKGGVFQTDTFSSMDINGWIALWFFP